MKRILDFMLGGKGQAATSRVHFAFLGILGVSTLLCLVIPAATPYGLYLWLLSAAAIYLFWFFRFLGWIRDLQLRQKIPLLRDRFRAEGIRGIFKRSPRPPLSEEEISKSIRVTRGIWLAVGFVLLLGVINESPLAALFAFAIGLMCPALVSYPPNNRAERATWAGKAVFVATLTAYVFYGIDTNTGLLGWGAGFMCGYATFFNEEDAVWRFLYRRDRWQCLKTELLAIAKTLSRLGGKP